MNPPKLLMSPVEAARALSMSRSKLYGLWASGDPEAAPPFMTIGGQRYVSVARLEHWIAEQEDKSTAKRASALDRKATN